jgi:hypothetical protein
LGEENNPKPQWQLINVGFILFITGKPKNQCFSRTFPVWISISLVLPKIKCESHRYVSRKIAKSKADAIIEIFHFRFMALCPHVKILL